MTAPTNHLTRPLCALLLLAGLCAGQQPGYSERFDGPGINGRVFGVGTWNGQLFAGGPFRFPVAGGKLEHLARFDGRDWQDVGGGVDGPVRAIASYGGELIVAGEFHTAGSVAASSIARWNGSRWAALGQGLTFTYGTAEVFALTVFQGELYAGGNFTHAGGQPIPTLARWDGTRWATVGGGLGGPLSAKVLSFADDGASLYIGGEFNSAGGQPALNIAVWDGSMWSALGSGITDSVFALALFQGRLYAGGTFPSAGGVPALKIAQWNGSAWGPVGLGIPDSSIAVQVNALQVYGQHLYVCGSFGNVDSTTRGGGIFAQGVARWDGSAWSAVGSGPSGLFRNAFGGQTYGIAATVHDGRLIVAGDFDHAGPIVDHANNVVSEDIVAWDGTRFHVVGEGLGGGGHKSVQWRGSIWRIGNVLYAGSVVSPRIARFDGARWHVVGPLHPRSEINDIIVFQDQLHVTGTLEFINGPTLSGVVRFDGTSWTPLGGPIGDVLAVHNGELYAGGLGYVQRLGSGGWVPLPSLFGQVQALCSFSGRLYIGGSNVRSSTGGSAPNLLVWDGVALAPVGSGLNGSVTVLHEHGGELWIGGWFGTAGGLPSRRLARFDGSQYHAFGGLPAASWVLALASLGGDLYVAGELGTIGGINPRIARYDGTQVVPLGIGISSNATGLLPIEYTGTLWITGGFEQAGGKTAEGFATWHSRPRWVDLGEALPGPAGAPLLEAFGSLSGTVTFEASGFGAGDPLALVLGTAAGNVPWFGGVMVPRLDLVGVIMTDPAGHVRLDLRTPPSLPTGFSLWAQAWSINVATSRIVASNAIFGQR